jgi:hypothetical protein
LKQRQLAADRAAAAVSDANPHQPRDGEDDDPAERLRMLAEVRRQREEEREVARRERAVPKPLAGVLDSRLQSKREVTGADGDDFRLATAASVAVQPLLDPEARKRQEMFADIMAEKKGVKGRLDSHSKEGDVPPPIARFSRRGASEASQTSVTSRELVL